MTVAEWIVMATQRLRAQGIESPLLEAQVLASHILLVDRTWLFAHPEAEFPDLAGELLLQRREQSEPLAYIIGSREFFGRKFRVTPAVLIPRQDTETLVEVALSLALSPNANVLDLGTGSGCIAITLSLEKPTWQVTAIDISRPALDVAEINAESLGAKITLIESDRFQALPHQTFDLIITNPPYIGHEEPLASEVAEFEPQIALYAEESGLLFYRYLQQEALAHLNPRGYLAMEVGYRQAESVRNLFTTPWRVVKTVKDLNQIERVVLVQAN